MLIPGFVLSTSDPCLNFDFYFVSIACLRLEIDTAAVFEKQRMPFFVGYVCAYFCMGSYKCDVVAVVNYIQGLLIFFGCLLSRFYDMFTNLKYLCTFVFVCSIKIFGKWLQLNGQRYTRVFAMQSC